MRRALEVLAAALLAGLAPAGCGDNNGPNGGGGPHVTIRLTDAPGDQIKAAVVTIAEINLQGGAQGKVGLLAGAVTTDLLTLANETAVLVDAAVVPAGTYTGLRFVLSGAYIETTDGRIFASSPTYEGLPSGAQVTGTLHMPSLGQSGLKVQFDGAQDLDIAADQDFLVDFDVAQSFGHEAGNSGRWVMHPVIKGASTTLAATVHATLKLASGVTLPKVGGNTVTLGDFKADLDGEVVPFTDPDGDGVFEAAFRFLLPGSHTLDLVVPAGLTITTNPVFPIQVQTDVGGQATAAATVLTATSP